MGQSPENGWQSSCVRAWIHMAQRGVTAETPAGC